VTAKRVVITGAGGFLARHVAERFRRDGWRTIGMGRSGPDDVAELYDSFQLSDLSDADRIATLLDEFRPDLIIHLAAPASVPESMRRPLADYEQHVLPTARLLEAMRLEGRGARMLLVSSAAVYGEPSKLPVREDAPLAPISPYGFHKLQQELLCDEYHEIFALPVVKARVFSTFGPGQRRLAVWDLACRALAGDASILGTGEEVRDYLYAADVAGALSTVTERAAFDGEAINIASGTGTTIAELASRICAIAGCTAPPRFTGERVVRLPVAWVADIAWLRSLGWSQEWSLDDALRNTIEWIRRDV